MTQEPKIFTWRSGEIAEVLPGTDKSSYYEKTFQYWMSGGQGVRPSGFCPYCTEKNAQIKLVEPPKWRKNRTAVIHHSHHEKHNCPQCGFWLEIQDYDGGYTNHVTNMRRAILQQFNINDASLEYEEIGTHLTRNYSDIYSLAPRKFEELIGDIYKSLGYEVKLTQQTNDGGCDLVLLESSRDEQILVECKRYAESRKVGVGLVRQLCGALVENEASKGVMVTSSGYSRDAEQYAKNIYSTHHRLSIDLRSAEDLLRCVGAYNLPLPLDNFRDKLQKGSSTWLSKVRRRFATDVMAQSGPNMDW